MISEENDIYIYREVEIQAALICNLETGDYWLNLSEIQKAEFRRTAMARMQKRARKGASYQPGMSYCKPESE